MIASGFYAVTLVDKTREYDEVFTFRFRSPEPIPFVPGQYVHLLAPGSPPGRENVRHLSIASVPEEGPLRFTMDLGSQSDYKQKFASLEPGGTAHLFKVKGDFVLGPQAPSRVVFLAGGIGITPIRSLIHHIGHQGLATDWRLAHVARGPFLYETELGEFPNLQARIRRRELAGLVAQWVPDVPGAVWYISGSARFVQGVSDLLRTHGISQESLRIEDFE